MQGAGRIHPIVRKNGERIRGEQNRGGHVSETRVPEPVVAGDGAALRHRAAVSRGLRWHRVPRLHPEGRQKSVVGHAGLLPVHPQ